MEESLDAAPPLRPAHRKQVNLLSGLMHAGLLVICLAAAYTLQPGLTPRQWAPYLVIAVVMLICAGVTRGRCGFADAGKLLTALGAAVVLRLAGEPQLANLPGIGAHIPSWLMGAYPGIATLGLILAAIAGGLFLRALSDYLGHSHEPPFLWAVNAGTILVLALSVVVFFTLRRLYEIDVMYLSLLVGSAIQYYLLLRLMLSASGRMRVGALPQVYFALAILLAFGRNLIGGAVLIGGEGP